MEQLFRIVLIFILLALSLLGFFTVMNVLFTKRISRTQNILQQVPGRSFGIGFVNVLFFLPIALLLFSVGDVTTGPLKAIITIPALFLLAVLLGLASFGLLSIVNIVGERIMPDQTLLKQTFWGTLLLSLACALPFIGWFLLLPCILIIGVGAVILGFFQRESN
jgi:hypothetical protein